MLEQSMHACLSELEMKLAKRVCWRGNEGLVEVRLLARCSCEQGKSLEQGSTPDLGFCCSPTTRHLLPSCELKIAGGAKRMTLELIAEAVAGRELKEQEREQLGERNRVREGADDASSGEKVRSRGRDMAGEQLSHRRREN